MDAYVQKLGYNRAGPLCLKYKKEDGTRMLYVRAGTVMIEHVIGKRAETILPTGVMLMELKEKINSADIVFIPISFQYTHQGKNRTPSYLTNQTTHSGVLLLQRSTATYFDTHIRQRGLLKFHCEYKKLTDHLPIIVKKLYPRAEKQRRYWRFSRSEA